MNMGFCVLPQMSLLLVLINVLRTHMDTGQRCAEKPGAAFVGHLDPGRHTLKVAHWTKVMGDHAGHDA